MQVSTHILEISIKNSNDCLSVFLIQHFTMKKAIANLKIPFLRNAKMYLVQSWLATSVTYSYLVPLYSCSATPNKEYECKLSLYTDHTNIGLLVVTR